MLSLSVWAQVLFVVVVFLGVLNNTIAPKKPAVRKVFFARVPKPTKPVKPEEVQGDANVAQNPETTEQTQEFFS